MILRELNRKIDEKKRRILVVEDNEVNRSMLTDILSDEYDVVTAENGKEGLEILRTQGQYISAIMLDIIMPVMNGYEFLQYVSSDSVFCKIPVVVTTVMDSVSEEEKCLLLGATDFIAKPYNPKLIRMRVGNIIRLRECDCKISELEIDALTGLKNRKAYYEDIKVIESDPDRSSRPVGVVFADINGLKRINDRAGHEAGDMLIANIAKDLTEVFEGENIYRLGGDEFVVISFDNNKETFKDRIELLESRWRNGGSAAIGSVWLDNANNLEQTVAMADKEMYKEKNRYYAVKAEYIEGNDNALQEEAAISGALSKEYSSLFKIDARTGKMTLYRTDGIGMSREYLESLLTIDDYESVLRNYIDNFVVPQDRDRIRELGKLNVLLECVPETGLYKLGYRRKLDNVISYYEMDIAKTVDRDGRITFILGLRDVDEETRRQLRQTKELELQREIIEGLGSEYYSVLLVNPEKDIVTTYRAQDEEGLAVKEYFDRYHNCWSKGIYSYSQEMISDVSRSEFARKLSLDFIRDNNIDYTFTYEKLTQDGIVYLQARVAYVRDNDGTRAVVVGTRSVDDLIKKEKQQEKALKAALNDAETANRAKTDLLSRMSHDIRTPLNGIIGLLEMDERHPEDIEQIQENRRKMKVAANHLNSLLSDILQLSKLENGNVSLSHEVVDMNVLATDILTMAALEAANHGITFIHGDCSQNLVVPFVYGSPLHLRQIFLNIFSNAIKYNKPGGSISCKVECNSINGKKVIYSCTISDTGIGMNKEYIKHIFEPFSQERSDARSTYQGTGLGMAIVKNLVDLMGGTIDIESREGEGSTFIVTIPFEVANSCEVKVEENKKGLMSIQGLRVLLVEDNEINMEIAELLLEDEGAIVTKAFDGKQAVDIFANNPPGTFDMILMDVMMPVMNGIEAARAIRAMDRSDAGQIPIIAMTANAFEEDRQATKKAGMNAHLSKPLKGEMVLQAISNYCQR